MRILHFRYVEVTNKVLDAEAMVTVRFLQLDFSLLKNAIAAHCREWQLRLINLLMEMTVEDLSEIYNYMSNMTKRLVSSDLRLKQMPV